MTKNDEQRNWREKNLTEKITKMDGRKSKNKTKQKYGQNWRKNYKKFDGEKNLENKYLKEKNENQQMK